MTDALIANYLEWLAECRRSPRTIRLRRQVLTRLDNDLPQGLVTANADEIKGWVFRPNWGRATLCAYYAAAASFFAWACGPLSPDPLDYNPMSAIRRPEAEQGLPRPVSEDQLAAILARSDEPFRLWALLGAYEGLRCIEVAGLHREHVTAADLLVVRGKGGKSAVLPTHPLVWEAVRDLPDGPLAKTLTGNPATAHYVSIQAAVYFRSIGVPVTMHRLRHRFGTEIYRQTKDLRKTQELMRHATPDTTAVYTQIVSEERRDAILTLPTHPGA
jgi:integrase/recombinase XerC